MQVQFAGALAAVGTGTNPQGASSPSSPSVDPDYLMKYAITIRGRCFDIANKNIQDITNKHKDECEALISDREALETATNPLRA